MESRFENYWGVQSSLLTKEVSSTVAIVIKSSWVVEQKEVDDGTSKTVRHFSHKLRQGEHSSSVHFTVEKKQGEKEEMRDRREEWQGKAGKNLVLTSSPLS